MFERTILASLLLASTTTLAAAADIPSASQPELRERGRYLVTVAGCNDCHTAGYAQSGGRIPESMWLLGDSLGFAGPWGTTYPANLRLRLQAMDLATFRLYAKGLTTRPPMPYWSINAMSEHDLDALFAFVKSLGPAGSPAPTALPPGTLAKGPVVQFPGPPAALAGH